VAFAPDISMTTPGPIFILGIMPRSGTNWLRDLLLCHPDCYAAKVHEDFLLANSHLLMRFGASLYRTWPEKWRAQEQVGPQERLQALLGDALLGFIGQEQEARPGDGDPSSRPCRRLVTKTPSTTHLEFCFNFFPRYQLIILVRDDRAVVESIVRGFSWDYETAIRRWDSAAREILRFLAGSGTDRRRTILVRYEDLYSAPRTELERVLAFLNLDPASYDFGRALGIPIRGSSITGDEPVTTGPDSSPLHRADSWDHWRHERFNRVAGESLKALGYQPMANGKRSPFTSVAHWFHDARWSAPRKLLSVGFLLKRALGRSDPDFKDARSVYYVRERQAVVRPPEQGAPRATPE